MNIRIHFYNDSVVEMQTQLMAALDNMEKRIHNDSVDSEAKVLSFLTSMEEHIMTAVSDFAAAQTAFQGRVDAAVAGISSDLDALKAQIAALQATQGQITPEDQALLDDIQAKAAAVADKLDALDALTPPVVPPAP